MTISHLSTNLATGLVPVIPIRREPIAEDQAALQIEILRQRQLERADVQKKLRQLAERKGVSR